MALSAETVRILACPKCKGELEQTHEPDGFGCRSCALLFKVEDMIPNFIIEEAEPWDDKEAAE